MDIYRLWQDADGSLKLRQPTFDDTEPMDFPAPGTDDSSDEDVDSEFDDGYGVDV